MSIGAAGIHEGWLAAGKRATSGDDALATAGDDAAFAQALASLTKRQRQIVRLRARGLTIAEICGRYYLSENTVKNHLRGAFRTLGLGSLRHQARLGRACYLLGRYDGRQESGRNGETARRPVVSRKKTKGSAVALAAVTSTRRVTDVDRHLPASPRRHEQR